MRSVPRTAKLETARADSTRRVRPLWSASPNRTPGASGAPDICRPHASVLAAGPKEYEARAVSRRRGPCRARLRGGVARAERRRPPNSLALRRPPS